MNSLLGCNAIQRQSPFYSQWTLFVPSLTLFSIMQYPTNNPIDISNSNIHRIITSTTPTGSSPQSMTTTLNQTVTEKQDSDVQESNWTSPNSALPTQHSNSNCAKTHSDTCEPSKLHVMPLPYPKDHPMPKMKRKSRLQLPVLSMHNHLLRVL